LQPESTALTELDKRLLNDFQQDLPVSERPFAIMAQQLGVSEDEVLQRLKDLKERGYITRVGPVFRPNRVGASTLAALAVPPPDLDEVAALVSSYAEVNHNYEREHEFNLWFVLTAPDRDRIQEVLTEIQARTGLEPINLPMVRDFHINLGFPIHWS
jgi:DNA-binding Lrp family transcriptional regulator